MFLFVVNLFAFLIAILGLIILWWVWPPDSPWSLWWRTNGKKAKAATRLAKISDKDYVYELGSGDATFLITACKSTGAKGIGVEIDYIRHVIGFLNVYKNGLQKKIRLENKNFFKVNLKSATVVFVYLVPRVLEDLKPKLYKDLKKGTKIISFRYKFNISKKDKLRLVGEDKRNQMYLYKII